MCAGRSGGAVRVNDEAAIVGISKIAGWTADKDLQVERAIVIALLDVDALVLGMRDRVRREVRVNRRGVRVIVVVIIDVRMEKRRTHRSHRHRGR
jgi:hypothetical protein